MPWAGAVIVRDAALAEQLKFLQNGLGSMSGAFDSFWMLLRGIEDPGGAHGAALGQRLAHRAASGSAPRPSNPCGPSGALASHPQHALARRQMLGGFGGIIAAELKGDLATARRFLERCELFSLGESLGGVESLIEHPALMTHSGLAGADAGRTGDQRWAGTHIRVASKSAADLIAELDAALG